jgi:Wzt C-terminal domain/Sulfotransferase family
MQNLLHFHIPKTGGSALRAYLVDQLGADNVSPSVTAMQFAEALVYWSGVRAISGHFYPKWGDRLPKDRCNLTILRDPVDRLLSEFYFAKSNYGGRMRNFDVKALELDDYLETIESPYAEVVSLQTRMLSPLGGRLSDAPDALSVNDQVVAAMRAMEDFQLIGVQEELEDFACMLVARFGWEAKPLRLVNVTAVRTKKSELSSSQHHRLQRLLEPELEVYRHAKSRFARDRREAIYASPARMIAGMPPHTDGVREENFGDPNAARSESDEDGSAPQRTTVGELGDKRCVITGVQVTGGAFGGDPMLSGERLIISITFTATESIDRLTVSLSIRDEHGVLVFGTNSLLLGVVYAIEPGTYVASYRMLNRMGPGNYSVDVSLTRNGYRYESCYHWLGKAAAFTVILSEADHFEGRIMMDPEIDIVTIPGDAKSGVRATAYQRSSLLEEQNEALDDFEASISETAKVNILHARSNVILPLRIENIGNRTWPATGRKPVTVSYHWLNSRGEIVVFDGLRTQLPSDVAARGVAMVPLQVRTPDEGGQFQLQISLVQEGVAWFVEKSVQSGRTLAVVVA